MTSPLNVISTKCATASCGTNDAKKRWLPSALTKLVTCPPFTRISKFPEPALDPSTDEQNHFFIIRNLRFRDLTARIRTFKFYRLVHHSVRDLPNLYSSGVVRLRSKIYVNNSLVDNLAKFVYFLILTYLIEYLIEYYRGVPEFVRVQFHKSF